MRSRGVGWPRWAVHPFVLLLAGIAPMLLASPRSAIGQTCRGDCDADLVVRVDELVLGVRIALGIEPRSLCEVLDTDQSLAVEVDELLGAVSTSFSGCPNTIRVHGMCLAPGAGGLEPCPAGTIVAAARCGLRRTCLGDPSSAVALGSARVAEDGSFAMTFDGEEVGASILVFDARLDGRAYRAVSFDLRAASAGVAPRTIEVLIDPISEAGAALLSENGFESFDDSGSREVLAAVRAATASLDFSGLASDAAVALATSTARQDTDVRQTIAERITPTPTPSATRTPTPTPTPRPLGQCDPGPLPTLLPATGATIHIGSAAGPPGSTVCVGATLQTADLPIVAFQLQVGFAPQARIPVDGERGACVLAPAFGRSTGTPFRPPGCVPGIDCTSVFFLAFASGAPRPDGSLAFTCAIEIAADAAPGDYALPCEDGAGSDSNGNAIDLGCVAGTVSVIVGDGSRPDAG